MMDMYGLHRESVFSGVAFRVWVDVLFAFGMGAKGAKVKRGHGNDGTSSAS